MESYKCDGATMPSFGKAKASDILPSREFKKQIAFVLIADTHFSHQPPPMYQGNDWYGVQLSRIQQLKEIATVGKHPFRQYAPILAAGDIFNTDKAHPELVNFLLQHLPHLIAIPGKYDLNGSKIHQTSYATLVEAVRITNLKHNEPHEIISAGKTYRLHGFPYGSPLFVLDKPCPLVTEIALLHRYVWVKGKGDESATEDNRLRSMKGLLENYDFVVMGGNHQGWSSRLGDTGLLECGSVS